MGLEQAKDASLDARVGKLEAALAGVVSALKTISAPVEPPPPPVDPPPPVEDPPADPPPVDPPPPPPSEPPVSGPPVSAGGGNAYFESLAANPAAVKIFSFRNQSEIDAVSQKSSTKTVVPNEYVRYDPTVDAARVIVPKWRPDTLGVLGQDISTDDVKVLLDTTNTSAWGRERPLQVDNEIIWKPAEGKLVDKVLDVKRGCWGTTPAAHSKGSPLKVWNNNLLNQVRVPLVTEDGHDYIITWDSMMNRDFIHIGGYKHFQLTRAKNIWFELQMFFKPRVAEECGYIDIRTYQGGGRTLEEAYGPGAGPGHAPTTMDFYTMDKVWTRYWVRCEQRVGFDLMSVWVADETRDPVLILDRYPVENSPTGIDQFYVEYNTSESAGTEGRPDELVGLVRNFIMLRDVPIEPLLMKPA